MVGNVIVKSELFLFSIYYFLHKQACMQSQIFKKSTCGGHFKFK